MNLRRTQAGLSAASALALAAGPAPLGLAAVTEEPFRPLEVTVPAAVAKAGPASPYSYSGPSAVVDPADPMRVYAAAVELRTRRCVFFRSGDGGRTWTRPASSPSLRSFPFCTHTSPFRPLTSLAMGRNGALYYLHLGWSHQDQGAVETTSVFLARSTNGGDSWSVAPVHDARRLARSDEVNYPIDLVVDSRSGERDVVYVSWTATFPDSLPARPAQPMIAVSVDAGRSFSPPANATGRFFDDPGNISGELPEALKRNSHFGGAEPDLALDGGGNLYVAWARTSETITPVPSHPRYLSVSSDRTRTFQVRQLTPPGTFAGPAAGPILEWSRLGGPRGSLHLVYEDKVVAEQGDRDVLHRRSTDGGTTWSGARALNDDDPAQLFVQVLPSLSVAPDGRLDVAWWDRRDSAGLYAVDVFSTSSLDGGATWSANRRLTDRRVNRSTGSWVDHHGDTRQRPGITSAVAAAHVVWDDTRNGENDGRQSLYAASVQFASVTPGSPPPWKMYAGVAVAGFVSGVLLIATLRHRTRTD